MAPRNLPDLIEDNAAWYGIAPRKLWRWALDAIANDVLVPAFPAGQSLDGKYPLGGMPWTLGKIVRTAHKAIDSYRPSNDLWAKSLMFDPDQFDRWLRKVLRDHEIPVIPKRAAGRKKTKREKISAFIAESYPDDIPADKTVVRDFEAKFKDSVSERTVRRARGRA
jgi:hypothetical protein